MNTPHVHEITWGSYEAERDKPVNLNSHHMFWRKTAYRRPLEKEFRNHPGLRVVMDVDRHKELHAQINEPPKPTRGMMYDVIEQLDKIPERDRHTNGWGILTTKAYFDGLAQREQNPELAVRALEISDHLKCQLGFIGISSLVEAYEPIAA